MDDKTSPNRVEAGINVRADSIVERSPTNAGVTKSPVEDVDTRSSWLSALGKWGVESRGIYPVPVEERTDPQYGKACFVWLSYNLNILAFSLGTIGPLVNGLSFRTSAGVIVGFGLLAGIPPAYLATFGPKLGLRQLVQARYSFGYYGTIIPGILSLLGIVGYNVINVILGGQVLSVVSGGSLSWNVGIVIITLTALVISFFGYQLLHLYERIAWFPIFIVWLVFLGVGTKHLSPPSYIATGTPETYQGVLGLGSSIAGYIISYSPGMSDYTLYLRPEMNSWAIFALAYLGLVFPTVSVALIATAFTASASTNPTWQAGYDAAGVGGLVAAVLEPLGGFGKFLTVLLGLGVIANVAPNFYSFCFCFQVVVPPLARVPRYVFSVVGTAVVIPLAITAAKRFEDTLVNFLGIVGYWCSTFVSVLIIEHIYFRHSSFPSYDISAWNDPRRLPPGMAALAACVLAFGVIVLCMNQAWYVGPVAKKTGDIGLEVGLVLTVVLYTPLRMFEKRIYGR